MFLYIRNTRVSSTHNAIQVLSWYPPGMADDNGGDNQDIVSVLLDEAQSHGIRIAFLIEPYANLTVGFQL